VYRGLPYIDIRNSNFTRRRADFIRSVAEEYTEGSPSYQYTGLRGLSWGIPYAAGVLALGWQVNPTLEEEQIIRILFESCSIAKDGSNIINPRAVIDAI
jgi:hypothetical protein